MGDADAVSSRTPRPPSGPMLLFEFVADGAGLAAARARAASAVGTTPREQLSWLLERFLPAALPKMRRDGGLGEVFLELSHLVMLATRGAWVPAPLPRSKEELPVHGVDRAPWQRLPAHERSELVRARLAGQSTTTVRRANDAVLYRLLADAQGSVYFAINSTRQPAKITEWSVIDAEVIVGLYERGTGQREFGATSVAALPAAAMVATMALLGQVRPSLVRECPYEEGKKSRPPHYFLGVKSQHWCNKHRDAARRDQLRAAQIRHRKGTPSPGTTRMKGRPR